MRVIDPKQRQVKPARKRSAKKLVLFVIALLLIGGVIFFIRTEKTAEPSKAASTVSENQGLQLDTKPNSGKLKQFTGQQFQDLYATFTYPNTKLINEDTPITGDVEADKNIRRVAVARGYHIRSAPVSNTFQDVGDGYLLQQRAAQPWLDLKAAAKKDGINLGLTAAYRSADDQKELFLQQLQHIGLTPVGIATGAYDAQISQILRSTAIPGYSRHHTGYTIDIACLDAPTSSFMYTDCFKWLSANNYEHAKTYGIIPSYPEGTVNQGPDPESWEYVWVGTDVLTQ